MISEWEGDDFAELRSKLTAASPDVVEDEFRRFLDEDNEGLNRSQRVILVAEEFDYEVLVTAEWLSEQYGVAISCHRLALSTDGRSEYLACVRVFPPTKAAEQAIRRKRKTTRPCKWTDWEAAIQGMANPALAQFFRQELASARDNYLRKRVLRYHLDGRRRWNVHGRQDQAYVWQNGRFEGDEVFWTERLGAAADVKPVKESACLRFNLTTQNQFEQFLKIVSSEIKPTQFADAGKSAMAE